MIKAEKYFSPNYLIYGCLVEAPSHGYEIYQRISSDLNYVWSISQSQLYALLKRLENQGMIIGEVVPQKGRPNRKRFSISTDAKNDYEKWLHMPVWVSMRALRMELLTKIYFLSSQNPQSIKSLVNNQIHAVNQALDGIAVQLSKISPEQSINRISLQIKQAQIQMMLVYLTKLDVEQFRS